MTSCMSKYFQLQKYFIKTFCGFLGFSLSKGINVCRDKTVHICISLNPAKARLTLGQVVVVVGLLKIKGSLKIQVSLAKIKCEIDKLLPILKSSKQLLPI